jgi:hypothetical protein
VGFVGAGPTAGDAQANAALEKDGSGRMMIEGSGRYVRGFVCRLSRLGHPQVLATDETRASGRAVESPSLGSRRYAVASTASGQEKAWFRRRRGWDGGAER